MKANLFAIAFLTFIGAVTGAKAEPFRIIVTEEQAPLVPNSVLYLAKSEGYFERAGVEVTLIPVQQTPMAIAALQSGTGDMANISLESLLALHREGANDIAAVGSTDKSLPFMIVGRAGVDLANLTGKRFGIGRPNSLDHTLSATVFASKSLDLNKMQLIPLGQPATRAQALQAGLIDATTISIGTYLTLPNRDDYVTLIGKDDYYRAAPVVSKVNVVKQDTLRTKSDALERVLEALTLAARDYRAKPEMWATAMARLRPDVQKETLDELATSYRHSWSVNGGLQKAELIFAQSWYEKGLDYNSRYSVDLVRWANFGPLDTVLKKIGISSDGDLVSR